MSWLWQWNNYFLIGVLISKCCNSILAGKRTLLIQILVFLGLIPSLGFEGSSLVFPPCLTLPVCLPERNKPPDLQYLHPGEPFLVLSPIFISLKVIGLLLVFSFHVIWACAQGVTLNHIFHSSNQSLSLGCLQPSAYCLTFCFCSCRFRDSFTM